MIIHEYIGQLREHLAKSTKKSEGRYRHYLTERIAKLTDIEERGVRKPPGVARDSRGYEDWEREDL